MVCAISTDTARLNDDLKSESQALALIHTDVAAGCNSRVVSTGGLDLVAAAGANRSQGRR